MADNGIACSMGRSGNVWDNAAMESFFSSLKTERTAAKTYRTRDEARADVFADVSLSGNILRVDPGRFGEHYATYSDRDLSRFGFHLGLASFKLVAITEDIRYRQLQGRRWGSDPVSA